MGGVLVDAGFLVALLSRGDRHHAWAAAQLPGLPAPWQTCEAALSEAFHLVGPRGRPALGAPLRRGAVVPAFHLASEQGRALGLMQKYQDVPMSLADACLVRMSEMVTDPVVLTTDADSRVHRRHGGQAIPCRTP